MSDKTEDKWIERFGEPLETSEGSTLFETYGKDFENVKAADPLTVWTVVEGFETENQYLLPGFHFVNRIGYVLAEKPITEEELSSREWDEVLWTDYGIDDDDDDTLAP
ncbi:hypothetical protein G6L37_07255 [Agrobacterium rubi]|nr:hypothetical protein [Agrobacterium rubi]NTF25164.1 hypothetical protein [Agrobacterium rubi]